MRGRFCTSLKIFNENNEKKKGIYTIFIFHHASLYKVFLSIYFVSVAPRENL